MATLPKRGRKPKPFITRDDKHVNGLRRRENDGRWVIVADGRMFTEHDEEAAVRRFRAMTGERPLPTLKEAAQAGALLSGHLGTFSGKLYAVILRAWEEEADSDGHNVDEIPERRIWEFFAGEVRSRPKYVAKATGVEEIGYLNQLKPREKLPTFAELEKVWEKHAETKPEEKRKVIAAWKYFVQTSGADGLEDINPQRCVAFSDAVKRRKLGGKTESHLFNRIKRLLRFAQLERHLAVTEIGAALTAMAVLSSKKTSVQLAPKPISREDWSKLLKVATGDDRALLLLCLNCALYLQEAVDMRWENISEGQYLIANRKKKGSVLRVAVLWPETIAALNAMQRNGDHIFNSYQGTPLTVSGAGKRWRKLRESAKVSKTLEANQLRDGALTAITKSTGTDDADKAVANHLCNLVAGHRSGIRDHYVLRDPGMVKPATDAIYRAYMSQD